MFQWLNTVLVNQPVKVNYEQIRPHDTTAHVSCDVELHTQARTVCG